MEKEGQRASGSRARPPKRKKHTFLWLLVCAAFLFCGWSLRQQAGRSRQNRSALSALSITVTPRPSTSPRPTASPRPSATPKPTATPRADGVSPEFKRYMDSYEEFFDEYLEFMRSLDEEGDGFGFLLKYAAMMERYAEVMDSLDAIDEEELSTADEIYYLEVLSRIERKLLEASSED